MFLSHDVQAAAGLSSRQQNDWDARGALPHRRSGEEGWRRFSLRELFVLATCAEIRRRFGVRVERLKWVQDFMLKEEVDHLQQAAGVMLFREAVWLLTDLEKTFLLSPDPKFESLWRHLSFDVRDQSAFVLLNLTPLVDRVLGRLDDDIRLEAHGYGEEELRQIRMVADGTPEEADVLQVTRTDEPE
jgi:hypothetical protein